MVIPPEYKTISFDAVHSLQPSRQKDIYKMSYQDKQDILPRDLADVQKMS